MIYKLHSLRKNKLIGQCVLSEKMDQLSFYLNADGQNLWELIKIEVENINKRGKFRVIISGEEMKLTKLTPVFFQALRQQLFSHLELALIAS